MEFRLLGPVQVWADGRLLQLGGAQRRTLLAMLLLNANRVVPADRLVRLLWGNAPPKTARASLQMQLSRLRRLLAGCAGSEGAGDRLVFRAPGYLLCVLPGELDLDEFRRLADAGRRELAAGDPERAEHLLRAGLRLWQGRALEDADPPLAAQTAALEERRLAALEDRIEAGLRCGRHAELVAELADLVAEHPLRERPRAQLMLALYRAGRRPEALAAYRDARRVLTEELGIEPGEELRRLEREILAAAPSLDPPPPPAGPAAPASGPVPAAAAPPPAQLPADLADFVGRGAALERLSALLPGDPAAAPGPVVISAIAGSAGVGKTALAVHWAHQAARRFPDGQLYVDLHGYALGPPLRPIQALAHLLHGLGVEADAVPVEVEQAAALYRSLLAGKRLLIVLDNARDAAQVRPLLPGSPGCAALITSRDRLAGLVATHGARRLILEALPADEAIALLARAVGEQRVAAEAAAAAELAQICGHLPLALRIAAANLTVHPEEPIAGYVAELREGDPVTALEVDGDPQAAVRVAFDLSYQRLAPDARRLFRLLGLVPGAEVGADAAAALGGTPPARARRLLDRLVAGHLIEERRAGRFTLHDLLRLYARQRSDRDDTAPERQLATGRLLSWYLHGADAAARLLYPQLVRLPLPDPEPRLPPVGLHDQSGAVEWLDVEQANLVAAIIAAARSGPRALAWLLADTLRGYFWFRRSSADWLAVAAAGLSAAEDEGDPRAQAAMRLVFGDAHESLGQPAQAIEHFTAAAALARRAGWVEGQAVAVANLGSLYKDTGRLELAAEHHAEALALYRQAGQLPGQAACLGSLGTVYRMMGRLRQAADHLTQSLELFRRSGMQLAEATALCNLADVFLDLGEPDRAHDLVSSALTLHRRAGDRYGEVYDRGLLAAAQRDTGRHAQALESVQAALALAREIGESRGEAEALNIAGSIELRLGRPQEAIGHYRRALELTRAPGNHYPEAEALLGLAAAQLALADRDHALEHARQALALARQGGFRILEDRALAALGQAQVRGG